MLRDTRVGNCFPESTGTGKAVLEVTHPSSKQQMLVNRWTVPGRQHALQLLPNFPKLSNYQMFLDPYSRAQRLPSWVYVEVHG